MALIDILDNDHMKTYGKRAVRKTKRIAYVITTFLRPSNNEEEIGIFTVAQVRTILIVTIIAPVIVAIVSSLLPSTIWSALTAIVMTVIGLTALIKAHVIDSIVNKL